MSIVSSAGVVTNWNPKRMETIAREGQIGRKEVERIIMQRNMKDGKNTQQSGVGKLDHNSFRLDA
jgi:hypothetical protein